MSLDQMMDELFIVHSLQVDVGAACKESLRKLSLSELQLRQLRSESQIVMASIMSLVAYMLQKLPLKHNLVCNLSCLDPREIVHKRDDRISRIG